MTPSSPRSRHPRSWPLLALALALACLAMPAWAGVENPRDTPAVQAVQFDMAMVKRLDAVRQAVEDIDDTPPLFMRTKPGKVQKTLDELLVELHTSAALEAAVKAQGFTPRQYLLGAMAWANAWFAYHLAKTGDNDHDRMNASPSQLRFVEQHYAELKALQEQL